MEIPILNSQFQTETSC